MKSSLLLAAGPKALARLQEHGLTPGLVRGMLAASGGPKGLMLLQLDRYLLSEFFPQSSQPVDVLGTSIGAWRMACYTQQRPLDAIDRFEEMYLSQSYSEKPDTAEITREISRLLDGILGEKGVAEIVRNPRFRLHVIAARGRGLASSQSRPSLILSMLLLMAGNVFSVKTPYRFYERVMFRHPEGAFPWHDTLPLAGEVSLSEANVRDALLATGSIPLVLDGVRDIEGAPAGLYWDGGLTDYHLTTPLAEQEGIVLYPHFFPRMVTGWFDKSLGWRVPNTADLDQVLVLSPSASFIESLPYGRIPDRQDFLKLKTDERLRYWRQVLEATRRLVDELHELLSTGRGLAAVKPLGFERYGQLAH